MEDTINSIIDELNPSEVDFNNFTEGFVFVNYWLTIVVLVGLLLLGIRRRRSVVAFIRGVRYELKQVEWLKRSDLYKYSLITIGFVVATTLFLIGVDQGFLELRNIIIFN